MGGVYLVISKYQNFSVNLQCYPKSMHAMGLAGMNMSAPSLPQYQDSFEHVNRVVLINVQLGFSDEICYVNTKLK